MPVPPPSPQPLQHLLISASAGSGKTYQLARRYAHLLALGEDAEGIAAMTFTRKAAGEFFNRILRRLAELATAPETAVKFFEGASPPVPAALDYAAMLRRLTRRMHRLRLGTMDSFFAGMAACFPLELGLPAGARVMDEDEARQARGEALDALLDKLYAEEDDKSLRVLMEAHKQATFGTSEKTVDATLQQWAESGLALWEDSVDLETDGYRGWGAMGRIWGGKAPRAGAVADAAAAVRRDFIPPHDAGKDLLEETLQAALECEPGMTLSKRVKELLEKAEALWPDLVRDRGEIMWMRKKLPLDGAPARALRALVETLMAREFVVRAERTRGLAAVVGLFALEYSRRVRARGRLSFADVQRLLSCAARERSPWMGEGGDLWYRMDGRYHHWLVDEFQDTSRTQWQVVGGLVDEVIQDSGGQRSFFAVGDPKQSIYLWRQAEPDLFDDVLKAYPKKGPLGLQRQPLSVSFRSAQPVLDGVNAVFGNTQALAELMPAGSLKGFEFQAHEASKKELDGHAALLSPKGGGQETEPQDAAEVAAALLLRIEPLKRGLSCAVLVRQNKDAREITEQLRTLTGMEVVCESDQHPCTDNAATLALLSLLALAAHPGDRQARQHLQMSPLWLQVSGDGTAWRREINKVQKLVAGHGFAAFMAEWTPRVMQAHAGLDAFHVLRLGQMADMAAEFDATGSRDLDAFAQFAREYPLRSRSRARAVQVMTIHAAKGLEFDLVILPTLDGDAMNKVRREDLLVSRDAGGVRWVLQSPPKIYAKLDETLRSELVEAERRAAFESLCRLYVAMTRAKRGLYLIAETAPKTAAALKESKLLRSTLPAGQGAASGEEPWQVEWQTGNAAWYVPLTAAPAPEPAQAAPPAETLGALLRQTQPMPRRRTPSGEETFKIKGSVLFGAGRDPGRRLGTLVHELFAEVEWLEPAATAEKRWRAKGLLPGGDEAAATAAAMVMQVLAAQECEAVFRPMSPRSLVWRERPFDLVMGDEWVSGIFDRVLLDRDEAGRFTRAWIVDFKTDEAGTEEALLARVEGYRPQIQLYRQALEKLTGLAGREIRASLLFTRLRRLVEV